MKIIKQIFSPFFTLWAIFWFLGFVLLILPVIWFLKLFRSKTADSDFYNFGSGYARFWMFICGIPYRIHDREKYYKKGQPYVVCSNHISNMDIFSSSIPIYTPLRIFAKSEIKKMPFIGSAFSMVSVFVDRSNAESRRKSFEKISSELRNGGYSVLIYPEGTRNKTDYPLRDFYDGAFKLAIQAQVPIAFFVVTNTRSILNPRKLLMQPFGSIDVYFLPPYETKGLTDKDLYALKCKVHKDAWDLIVEKDPNFKNVTTYVAPKE